LQKVDASHKSVPLPSTFDGTDTSIECQRNANMRPEVDSQQMTYRFLPLRDRVKASLARERRIALLSGFFGIVALLLAGVGV
jgi:hypothetical protein